MHKFNIKRQCKTRHPVHIIIRYNDQLEAKLLHLLEPNSNSGVAKGALAPTSVLSRSVIIPRYPLTDEALPEQYQIPYSPGVWELTFQTIRSPRFHTKNYIILYGNFANDIDGVIMLQSKHHLPDLSCFSAAAKLQYTRVPVFVFYNIRAVFRLLEHAEQDVARLSAAAGRSKAPAFNRFSQRFMLSFLASLLRRIYLTQRCVSDQQPFGTGDSLSAAFHMLNQKAQSKTAAARAGILPKQQYSNRTCHYSPDAGMSRPPLPAAASLAASSALCLIVFSAALSRLFQAFAHSGSAAEH
jgi:hypothetical protein